MNTEQTSKIIFTYWFNNWISFELVPDNGYRKLGFVDKSVMK